MSGDPLDPCGGAFREAHAGPFFTADGKQMAAGERPRTFPLACDTAGRASRPGLDPKDPTRAKRPCSCCGRKFQPTARRRLLCAGCFRQASGPDG